MPKTIVALQGHCLASIADAHRFFDWRTIYDHADNEELRELRPSPNHLAPGDEVVIPDKGGRLEVRNTGSVHKFVLNRAPTKLRLRLEGLDAVRYELAVDQDVFSGSGSLVEHDVHAAADAAELRIWLDDGEDPTIVWQLAIGHVDPGETPSGLKRRLDNLGFSATVGPEIDPLTEQAAQDFQRSRDIEPSPLSPVVHEQVRDAHDEG